MPQVILITLFYCKRLFNRPEGQNTERELSYLQYTVNLESRDDDTDKHSVTETEIRHLYWK